MARRRRGSRIDSTTRMFLEEVLADLEGAGERARTRAAEWVEELRAKGLPPVGGSAFELGVYQAAVDGAVAHLRAVLA